jgi:flagellar M-ring protein FliF
VPELPVKNVTVVDQNGHLLSAQGDAQQQTGLDPGQLQYLKELEQSYAQRIESILVPVVGAANVRAQVAAEVDFSQTEQAEEVYRPNQGSQPAAVRSLNSSEAVEKGPANQGGGIPGALSNQPPAPASAPITAADTGNAAPGTAAGGAAANMRKDSSVNYEVDKSLKHTRHSTGTIKRLSVAVVVNHRKLTSKSGKVSLKPRSTEEMAQLDKLVREAMGFSDARGDTVTVANTPFSVEEPEPVEETPFWKQPGTIALAMSIGRHLLIAAVVLFVFLRVLRPLFRSAMSAPAQAAVAALPAANAAGGAAPGLPARGAPGYQNSLDSAKQLAQQEPKLVANIVSSWVAGDER